MHKGFRVARAVTVAGAVLSLGWAADATAQDREVGTFYNAKLTLVFTSGNAKANTLGLGAGIRRVWDRTEFSLQGGSLRTETGAITRTAVGTVDDFEVVKDTETTLTAENYFVTARLDRSLSNSVFLFGGAGWQRNTFAGYDSRFTVFGGLGNTWVEDDRTRFKTDYGVTYTTQNDVIDDPLTKDSFAGLRGAWNLWHQLTATTAFESLLVVNENLDETKDLRADFTNSLLIDISDALAFQTSVQILFDNLPSLSTIPLEGSPTTTVQAPLDKVDTLFTIALVASF